MNASDFRAPTKQHPRAQTSLCLLHPTAPLPRHPATTSPRGVACRQNCYRCKEKASSQLQHRYQKGRKGEKIPQSPSTHLPRWQRGALGCCWLPTLAASAHLPGGHRAFSHLQQHRSFSIPQLPKSSPASPLHPSHPWHSLAAGCRRRSAPAARAAPYLGLLSAAAAAASQWVRAGASVSSTQPHLLFAASPVQPSAGFRLQLPRVLLKCSAPIFSCCDPLAGLCTLVNLRLQSQCAFCDKGSPAAKTGPSQTFSLVLPCSV